MNQESLEHIENLLVGAIEGGSNYWYMIEDHNKKEISDCKFLSSLLVHEKAWMKVSHQEEPKGKVVKHSDVEQAWIKFSTDIKYTKHYRDIVEGNDDGDTADVFFQLLVIGDVIYG